MTDKALARDMSGEGLISLVTCSVAEQQSVFGNRAAGGLDLGLDALVAKGAVRGGFPVKVLGDGDITVAVTVKGAKASASAKAKIEAAGGSVSEN